LKHFWLLAHIFGFILWMGGGFAAMAVGMAMRQAHPAELAPMIRIQGRVHRGMILPGSLLVVVSGLLMTLRLYGSATSVNGFPIALMVMQGAGLLGLVLVLVVMVPTVSRLGRLDPTSGEHAPIFVVLSRRAALVGSVTGMLGLTALIGGVLLR
jgi:hypothetical protein